MSELRHDPLTGRWVVVVPERARRPSDFGGPMTAPPPEHCPFCPGSESLAGPELYASRPTDSARDTPGWRVRVVANRLPALRVEGELLREPEGFCDRVLGVGAHEVVIESPRHDATLGSLSEAEVLEILRGWQARMRDLAGDVRLACVAVFRNQGEKAGASLVHPHSQIVALPFIPPALTAELAGAAAHHARTQRCLTCDQLRYERSAGVRIVGENETAVALAPFASRVPFECWVLPRRHASRFEDEDRSTLRGVAAALRALVQRIDLALHRPDLRLSLVTAPLRESPSAHFHWRLELMPVTVTAGGLEVGSGLHLNPVAPETAAAFLRGAGQSEPA